MAENCICKIWRPYFSNLENGGQKGGLEKANQFSLKLLVKMIKMYFELEFQTKIGFPLSPILDPLFQIRKVGTLGFLKKKILMS